MKLAIVRQRYTPYGGAERFVERALRALSDRGADITLITRSWAGAPEKGFRQLICDPPYSRLLGGRAARDQSFSAAVQAEIARGDYDQVQSHERIPGCSLFRAGDGIHAAWLAHRARSLGPAGRLAQACSPYHRYVLAAEAALFAHPALRAVICNAPMVADEAIRFYGVPAEKLHIIPNGVDTEVFHPRLAEAFRQPLRAKLGIPEQAPLLLFVGSGFERKGLPRLLQALKNMKRTDARLIVVGEDRKRRAMEALTRRLDLVARVHFTGPLQDVRPCYGAADGFVLPTLYDPCPNAAQEALASGLPLVTTTTCGAQTWVREGENGWVIDALDLPGLSDRLDKLAELSGNGAARQAARAAVEALTLETLAERLLALYGGGKGGEGFE